MRTVLVLLISFLALPAARGEKADTPPQALREGATDVVVGKVRAVYARTAREGSWRVTRHLAEVEVQVTEKGRLEPGSLAYVRYWTQAFVGPGTMPPGTTGHRGLPREGETLRLHLVRRGYNGAGRTTDGGLDVYFANGFQRLSAAEAGAGTGDDAMHRRYAVVSTLTAKPGKIDEIAALFQETNPGLVADQPCWSSARMLVDRKTRTIRVVAIWSDVDAYRRFAAGPLREAMKRFLPLFEGPPTVEVHEVLAEM